jgi:2-dehydro-3-deoxygluconokinase
MMPHWKIWGCDIDKEAIEFAMAAGAIKHSVPGDILICSLQEVQELAAGDAGGKIKR